MNSLEAKQYLDSFINYELKSDIPYASSFKLDRVRKLLDFVGNPQKKLKIVHIAGTKGKGSTCAFTASILKNAGYKVGLYTSPHLSDDKERIRILDSSLDSDNNKDPFSGKIKEDDFCRWLEKIKPAVENVRQDKVLGRLSFFEIYTVLALCYFCEEKVDFAVLETGLGGRLDATNVVDSLICAITPISIEHTKQLGATLREIASEKAAIIKNKNQIAIIAPQEKEAFEVIERHCRGFGIKSFFVGRDICYQSFQNGFKKQRFTVRGIESQYTRLETKLLGRHQALNAAVAIGITESLRQLGFSVSESDIIKGIKNTIWPGRFEIVREQPFVVLDGAHNPGSCQMLAQTVQTIFPNKKVKLILGISKDKDIKGMCDHLNKIADSIILTKANHPRALDFTKVETKDLFGQKDVVFTENAKEAMDAAFAKAHKNGIILVAGSLFIVSESREICLNRN